MRSIVYIVLISAFIGVICATCSAKADMNTYAEGYRMGQLSKYSTKGWINKTGEGEILLGAESTPLVVEKVDSDGKTTSEIKNPWMFSTSTEVFNANQNMIGEYVVVPYREKLVHSGFSGDTSNVVEQFIKVDPSVFPENGCVNANATGSKSTGTRVGRLVKVADQGGINTTFEITMQIGNAGNQFIDMSITDETMFECAKQVLKSGQKIKLEYVQSLFRNPLNQETTYDVLTIVKLKELQ